MAKQIINVGATPNDKKGDSLRAAFTKVNANFTELYTALGLNSDGTLSLGAFEFNGSTMSTTDSTPIVIDQSVTVNSDLTVGGDIIPSISNGGNLGSPAKPFKSLYVSNNTVFLGGVPLSLEAGTNELKINNVPISQTINITDITGQSSFYKPSSILDYRTGPYYNLTSVPSGSVIIDYATYSWATGSSSSFYRSPVFRPSVYSATIDGSGNVTDIQITTAYSYPNPDVYPEFIDIENINTDNMFAIDAGIDITDPVAIAASSIFVMIDAGISSTPKPIPTDVSELTDNAGLLGQGGGQGLPSITIPATPVVLYKGLQASYGVIHSNNNSNELNVNKIVIHKPATTTSTIDSSGNQDNFQVSGIGSSDVLAMFVIYGDVNGAKPLSALQNFTRAVIDNVILVDGVAGDFRTVDQMKTAFYGNYQILASAAGGLYTNFQFFANSVNTISGGATTVREGSGAVFEIVIGGSGPYTYDGVTATTGGTNYRVGHTILVDGATLEGLSGTNDAIITVTSIDGSGGITGATISGTYGNARAAPFTYSDVTGTNYQVGSGLAISSINNNNGTLEISAFGLGNNYVVGDVITLLGNELEGGVTPDNDMTLTVTNAGNIRGPAFGVTVSGTLPQLWPLNNVSDGGVDQYDTGNYINTNLANEINYNSGNTVVDGTLAFGAGSTYSFVYDTAIFGLFVTGNGATSISTSGGSGADGGSTTETGYVFGGGTAAETFDNAVTHINIVGDPYVGEAVSFTKTDNGSEVDILIPDDGAGAGVGITRDGNQGIYNPYREGSWDSDVSPGGTLWNIAGWADLTDVETRTYTPLYEAFGFGGLGNKIVGSECVMYLPDNGKYYAVKFSQWTQGANGGGFAYTRRELNLTSLAEGIRFADGTVLKSAAGIGPVKLESPGNRRIEEVYGYKSVSVTARQTTNITATASRNATDEFRFWIDTTTTTIDDILNNTTAAGIWDPTTIEFSLDNVTWYKYAFNSTGAGNEIGYGVTLPQNNLNYNQGDTIYFRYSTGGAPVVWWDRNELPGGGTNFRGAIIDYHAYDTDSGTMIGTIHIARDSGDDNITHTEVFSGGTDGENIDMWIQTTEGELKYRRLDGESSTLKIQWSAKVFYGSEYWD